MLTMCIWCGICDRHARFATGAAKKEDYLSIKKQMVEGFHIKSVLELQNFVTPTPAAAAKPHPTVRKQGLLASTKRVLWHTL